jgi:hypothetical protein
MPSVQIFGVKSSPDTRAAERLEAIYLTQLEQERAEEKVIQERKHFKEATPP